MTQDDMQAYQARVAAFAAKVDAFAVTLNEEESAWLTQIIATTAGTDAAVNGYLNGSSPYFNVNAGNPTINLNLNVLTQTAVGVGNLGSVANAALAGQFGGARFRG
jgi:hypothetical protein